jgi:hypothetical protein
LRRHLPIISTLAALAFAGAVVAFAATSNSGTGASDGGSTESARASQVARVSTPVAASAEPTATATPEPTPEITPSPEPTPTEAPTPEPTPVPTPRPRTPPPPPPPTPAPNPNALSISGRVTDQTGAAYAGVCVTIGPPIRCVTTTAANGTYYVSLDSAPAGIAWDVRYLVGGVVKVEKLGVIVSGPVVLNVTIAR